MTFAETYREERLLNRRARARTARILGRIIGFCLTVCFVVALRTEPQLRALVTDMALVVIGSSQPADTDPQAEAIDAFGYAQGSKEAQVLEQLGIAGDMHQPERITARMPVSTVKVNRAWSGG
jgi:hypothetical protein